MNGLDLFSGIGGISMALSEYVKTIGYVEIDKYAQSVLLSRMVEGELEAAPIFSDITKLNKNIIYEIISLTKEGSDMAGKLKKLTEEDVKFACLEYERGSSLQDLAHIFGVSRQSMHDLLKRRITLRPQSRFGESNHFYRSGLRADKKAHDEMEAAIERGLLVNPRKCQSCGYMGAFKDGRTAIQGHHDDYNKPLSVRWLCQKCHHEWHKNNKPIPRKEGNEGSHIDIITGGFP